MTVNNERTGQRVRQALVFGGTGAVGREVLRGLGRSGVPTVFTYHRNAALAAQLSSELGHRAEPLDLRDAPAVRRLIDALAQQDELPDVLIHCAAVNPGGPLSELSDEQWDLAMAVNGRSAFAACQQLARRLPEGRGADVVLVGALDRTQSLPLPVAFAASQGLLGALAMSLAKELGPRGIRVNMVALGILGEGLSSGLEPRLRTDFESFSALRRVGSTAEAARAILWLALENTYMLGKVVPVNGGI